MFSVVAADHATTLIILDKLSKLQVMIYDEQGQTLNFHKALTVLKNKTGSLPEQVDLTTTHLDRDSILHKGGTISKRDTKHHLKVACEFFKRFLADEYNKRLPKKVNFCENIIGKKTRITLSAKNSLQQFLKSKQEKFDKPLIGFNQLFNSAEILLKLQGYKSDILRKTSILNLSSIQKLNEGNVITKKELDKLEIALKMKREIISLKISTPERKFSDMNKFLKQLNTKLMKQMKSTIGRDFEDMGSKILIELALSLNDSQKTKSRRKKI